MEPGSGPLLDRDPIDRPARRAIGEDGRRSVEAVDEMVLNGDVVPGIVVRGEAPAALPGLDSGVRVSRVGVRGRIGVEDARLPEPVARRLGPGRGLRAPLG